MLYVMTKQIKHSLEENSANLRWIEPGIKESIKLELKELKNAMYGYMKKFQHADFISLFIWKTEY